MYTVPCNKDHRFCYDDIKRHISDELSHNSIPSCPLCLHARYSFSAADIRQLFGSGPELDRFSNISAAISLSSSPNFFPCPTPDCAQYLALPGRARQCIRCPSCAADFCSRCRERYHYEISCSLVPAATMQWLDWASNGSRGAEAARQRREELWRDEKWKEANCRLCPQCSRPIERIEGCNAMQCGRDASGGNRQAGCATPHAPAGGAQCAEAHRRATALTWGVYEPNKLHAALALACSGACLLPRRHPGARRAPRPRLINLRWRARCLQRFNWDKAKPYVSPSAGARAPAPPPPAAAALTRLPPVRWSPSRSNPQLRCRACSRPARARLFRCIHCPGWFDVCAECDADADAGGPAGHPPAHVFVRLAPQPRLARRLEEAAEGAAARAARAAARAAAWELAIIRLLAVLLVSGLVAFVVLVILAALRKTS